jgi:hypothetical protein
MWYYLVDMDVYKHIPMFERMRVHVYVYVHACQVHLPPGGVCRRGVGLGGLIP